MLIIKKCMQYYCIKGNTRTEAVIAHQGRHLWARVHQHRASDTRQPALGTEHEAWGVKHVIRIALAQKICTVQCIL